MKNKRVEKDKITIFDRVGKSISDKIYDLKVALHQKRKKPKNQNGQSSMSTNKRSRLIFYYAMIALPLLHYLIFYIGVNFNSILLAFKEYKVINGQEQFVWNFTAQFSKIFETFVYGTTMKQMLLNSLTFYFFSLLVTVPLALIFSFYIYKKYVASGFFKIVLFLPSMISSVVTVFMYKYLVDVGIVEVLKSFGVKIMPPLSDPQYRMPAVIMFNLIISFGTNILMYSSAMTRIPVSVVEYAQLDGVSPLREFVSITIPLIFDTITTFLVVGIAGIFTNQANLYAMFGKEASMEVQTFGYHLFILTNMGITEANFPYAAALGIVFTLIVVPLTMLVRWGLGKINPNVQY